MGITDPKATIGGGRWMPFKNLSPETIPPYAVVQIAGTTIIDGAIVWKVIKPNGAVTVGNVAFNGPTEVASQAFGGCTYDVPCRARYSDENEDVIAVNDKVGPEAGEWHLKKNLAGFNVLGGIDYTLGYCLVGKSGSGSPQDQTCCGCSPTECFDFEFWEISDTETGDCPRYFVLTVDDDIACCDGESGGAHILEYQAATGYDPAMWKGPTFPCGTAGNDCGTASWTWTAGSDCGSATFEWQTPCGGCEYRYDPYSGGNPLGLGTWVLLHNNCDGCAGCSGPPSNNPFTMQFAYGLDPSETHFLTWPCEGEGAGEWVLVSGCECGSASAPSEPGTTNGEIVNVLCTGGGAAQWTLETNSCDCGDPVPPTEPGSMEGEVTTTACVDPNAPPECGTSTWERRVCEYIGIAADCSMTTRDLIGTGYYPTNECTLIVANGDNEGCSTPRNPINRGNIYGYRTPEGTWVGLQPGETLTESQWVLVSDDCTCGMAIPPRQDLYAPDGTQITRPCESPILAYWRLIPPTGYEVARVELVINGVVQITYKLPYLRTFCCKCQMRFDIEVDTTCLFPCLGIPQSVCVRPLRSGPPGGSCADLSPVYSLYVEGFEEWPCRSNTSDFCTERAARHDEELATWPITFEGHPKFANGSFTLALTERACCGNPFSDPGPTDTCESLACRWQSAPGTIGTLCASGPTWCVDGVTQVGPGDCDGGPDCETLWQTGGYGRWYLQNYTLDGSGNTVCGGGLKLYLSTSLQGDSTGNPGAAERYDWQETLDDGSLVFKYSVPSVYNPDKFPQYVMLVPVTSI